MTSGNYTTIIACLVELPGCHGGFEPVVGVWKIKIPINAEVRATRVDLHYDQKRCKSTLIKIRT